MKHVTSHPQIVGAVVQAHRKRVGFTQEQMAHLMKLKPSGWARVEAGETMINVVQLRRVAAIFSRKDPNNPVRDWQLLKQADETLARLKARTPGLKIVERRPKRKENPEWILLAGSALAGAVGALLVAGAQPERKKPPGAPGSGSRG